MSKNKIPTAEDFFKHYATYCQFEEGDPEYLVDKEDFLSAMKEFAKLHVKAALETAADKAEKKSPRVSYYGIGGTKEIPVVCGDIILNAYPETSIK